MTRANCYAEVVVPLEQIHLMKIWHAFQTSNINVSSSLSIHGTSEPPGATLIEIGSQFSAVTKRNILNNRKMNNTSHVYIYVWYILGKPTGIWQR